MVYGGFDDDVRTKADICSPSARGIRDTASLAEPGLFRDLVHFEAATKEAVANCLRSEGARRVSS